MWDEVLERDGNLSIPLYVRAANGSANGSGDGASFRIRVVRGCRS